MKYHYVESGEMYGNKEYGYYNKEVAPIEFSREDSWLAAALLVCGFLYWNLIHFVTLSAGVSIFTAVLCAVVWIYFKVKGIKQTKASIPWLGLVTIAAVNFLLFDDYLVKQFNFMLLSGSFLYWVCQSTGRSLDAKLSIYTLGDVANQLMLPFSNITCGYFGLKQGLTKNKYGKNVVYIIAGIVVFLPLMIVVIAQLSSADMAFEQLIKQILKAISFKTLIDYGLQFAIGIPVALYLYGSVYGNISGRHAADLNKKSLDTFAQNMRFAPKLTIYTALAIFNIIYLLFFLSQAAYLFSAFGNVLPDTMTYAEYARRGFFELCKVCTINMGIIMVANCFMRRTDVSDLKAQEAQNKETTLIEDIAAPKLLKLQTVILSVFTILLIITALSKMTMYIQYYGLTQLRVYTSWFMMVLLFTFIVIVARQIKEFNASRVVILGCIAAFLVLSYGNVDGNIAKYNIDRYEKGTLENLDYKMLFELSDAAVPYLYEHYKNATNEDEKTVIYNGITRRYPSEVVTETYGVTFRDFNLQTYQAEKIRNLLSHEEGRQNSRDFSDGKKLGYGEASTGEY